MENALLITTDALTALRQAERKLTMSDRMAFEAQHAPRLAAANNKTNDVGVARIKIEGVLVPRPNPLAFFLGISQSAYSKIQEALADADADPSVKRAVLEIDSPGGYVDGLFPTLDAIRAFSKPISVRAARACSGAYAIAAAAGKIEATNDAASFGSIGVAIEFYVDDDVVQITSTDAPNKRPDLRTESGRAVVRRQLDDIHELFVNAIAKGRGTTAARVNAEFGRGSVFLARDARRSGMIDSIAPPPRKGGSTEMALVEHMMAQAADIRSGKLRARPGEPERAFYLRVAAEGRAFVEGRDVDAEVEDYRDNGDLVAAAMGLPPARSGAPDLGDQVVAVLEQQRGLRRSVYQADAVDWLSSDGRDNGDLVADAMGLPPARGTGDLGDQVVAVLQQRGGRAAHAEERDNGDLVADAMGLPPVRSRTGGRA